MRWRPLLTRTVSMLITIALGGCATAATSTALAPPTGPVQLIVVDESTVVRQEPAPHGKIGTTTAYRISDVAPERAMEFRKRELHVGAAIGAHVISHDEVYYVLSGEGEVESNGETRRLRAGMAAYLYHGANVGIRQVGTEPLTLIVAYPLAQRKARDSAP
jgi:mannose-6-phosphate isomerase-like protein (cupin superfamily)